MSPRTTTLALLTALSALTSLSVAAQVGASSDAPHACALLHADDLAGSGFELGAPNGNMLRLTPAQSGAPSAMTVELCFHYTGAARRRSVNVSLETYDSADGVAAWLEARNRQAEADSAQVTQHDGSTCERGSYTQQTPNGERVLHYLACDRLDGRQRIGLGFESADGADTLPTSADAAQLLAALAKRTGANH